MENPTRYRIINSIQDIFSKYAKPHKLKKEAVNDLCPDYVETSHKFCNVYTYDNCYYAVCVYDELISNTIVYNVAVTAVYDAQEVYLEVDFENKKEFDDFIKTLKIEI